MTGITSVLAITAMLVVNAPHPGQVPQRDAVSRPAAATAALAGTVFTAEAEPRPVRRAVVSATPQAGRRAVMTVTDDDGRFALEGLPAGAYVVQSSKPGLITTYYGAKRPGRGPGVPVVVADGQRVQVALNMLKGAVIAGQVADEQGAPAANAGLQLLQYRTVNGERTLYGAYGGYGYASTDDRGFYRAFGLPPGDYLVAVTGRAYGNEGVHQMSAAEVQWAERQFASGASLPAVAGTATLPPSGPPVTAAPIYFPGTPDLALAQLVTVAAGEERSGVNFSIRNVPTARITGMVFDPEGRPASGVQVSLVATSLVPGDFVIAMSSAGRATATNGRFSMAGIAPGRYALTARTTSPSSPAQWAIHDLMIDGHDVTGIELRLEQGLTVSGRVVVEGGPPPPDVSRVRISLASVQTSSGITLTVPAGPIGPDGRFEVTGLILGRYRATVQPLTSPWIARSVTVGSVDALDVAVEISKGETSVVTVMLTDRAAELSGTVVDSTGKPTPEYSIIVFSTDRAMWFTNARRTRAMRLSSTGTFSMTGLPAGDYFLCAATDYDSADLSDPAFLAELAAVSYRVTLRPGEVVRQDLKVAR